MSGPTVHSRKPRLLLSALLWPPLLAAAFGAPPATAGVLQQVSVLFAPADGTPPLSDAEEVFVTSGDDIDAAIIAQVGQPPPAERFFAVAGAGIFGEVGLDVRLLRDARPGSVLSAEVLIGSDQFVNPFGRPAAVSASFIVDGGLLQDFGSGRSEITFSLGVGAESRGFAPPIDNPVEMAVNTAIAADLGGFAVPGGNYQVTLGLGGSFTEVIFGLDLGATMDATGRRIDIPFSLQTLDLGVLQPGERLLLAYAASIEIRQVQEGALGQFADPFSLSGEPILASLTFTPLDGPPAAVPGPGAAPLLVGALFALLLGRRRAIHREERE